MLAESAQCQECVVKQVFRYMAGRPDTAVDRPLIAGALEEFRKSGFRFPELVVYLAKSKDGRDTGGADAARNYQPR